MRWKRSIRGGIKWACTSLATVLIVATVASRWWEVDWALPRWPLRSTSIWITSGVICANQDPPGVKFVSGIQAEWNPGWEWGWHVPYGHFRESEWRCGVRLWRPSGGGWYVGTTLLYPVTLASLAAAYMWRRDMRIRARQRAGLCTKCGYDRKSLASAAAACPECGAGAA